MMGIGRGGAGEFVLQIDKTTHRLTEEDRRSLVWLLTSVLSHPVIEPVEEVST
jgi:hypothetical protein